jgi:hypothetical protein
MQQAHRGGAYAIEPQPDPLSPIFRQGMFWIPDRQAPSAWHEQVPFAFWLIDVLRPASILELGTHNGISYSAFCQAVKSFSLPTCCFAIDTWKGDEHAGFYGDEVYREFVAFHDQRYSAFSRLVRSTFDEALPHFDDGSIEAWLPKLSANAVVLFHDTNVREGSFGVSRFWEELTGSHKGLHFNFLHGHGLGVLGLGLNYSSPLRLLFDANQNGKLASGVREIFASIGRSTRLLCERSVLEQALGDREAELAALQKALSALDGELRPLKHALTEREAQFTSLQSTLVEREIQLSEREIQVCSLQSTISALYASSSWRVSAPLRAGKRLLDGMRTRVSAVGRKLTLRS